MMKKSSSSSSSSSSIICLRCRRLLSASNIRRSFVVLVTLFIVLSSTISIFVSTTSEYYNNNVNNNMIMELDNAPLTFNNSNNNDSDSDSNSNISSSSSSSSSKYYSSNNHHNNNNNNNNSTTTTTTTTIMKNIRNDSILTALSYKDIIVNEEQEGGELEKNSEGVVKHGGGGGDDDDADDEDYGKERDEEDLDGDDDDEKKEDDNINKIISSKPPRPPKTTYLKIDGVTNTTLIKQNLSELVDYGYIAFSKCGSTSISNWWRRHPEVRQESKESRLMWNGPIRAVNYVYKKFPTNETDGKKIAYKMPSDIYHPIAMKTIKENFPTTKLIIGIRHPILWFESFYNYWQSIANGSSRKYLSKNTTELIGDCITVGNEHVCTDHANFQYYISKFFWPYSSSSEKEEESTITTKPKTTLEMENNTTTTTTTTDATDTTIETQQSNNNNNNNNNNNVLTNPLFFYEISQLADKNETRTKQFRYDFQSFLGLSISLPKVPIKNKNNMSTKKRQKYAINICDDIHQPIRNVLMDHSINLVEWIRNSNFLYERSDLTVVSPSKDYFVNIILESYLHDPCDTRQKDEKEESITQKKQNKKEFKDIMKKITKQ